MNEPGFREMLLARGNAPTGVETRISYVKTIEKNLSGLGLPFADLDAAFEADGLTSVIDAVRGLIADHKAGGVAYRLLFPQSVNPRNRLSNLPTFLKHYRDYRSGGGMADSDAGRIRQFALKDFVEPARERGEASVTIRAGDLHNALGLSNAHANVCQALRGRLFRNLAGVGEPTVTGPENSSTTTFIFNLAAGAAAPPPQPRPSAKAMSQTTPPTNLILYGPPGTGKTFATAREAVKLCSPGVDLDDRAAVDAEYRRLVEARQVEFVTFHQSYSYEDFVEGLRPPVSSKDGEGEEDKSGFRLEVSPGVFHRIATRAAASKGSTGKSFDLTGRQVFKMSIGEAANPEDAARQLRKALAGTDLTVHPQGGRLYCLEEAETGTGRFMTKPDILVKRRGVVELIIDTKWKRVARQIADPKRGVSQSDIYQMVAYGQLYDCTDLLLLYPHHAELGSTVGVFGTHRITGTARLLRGATLGLHGDSKAELGALAIIRPLSGPPSHQRPTSSDPQQNAD